MSDQSKPARVSRRTVLIAAAGAVPLLALMSGSAEAKMAQTAVMFSAHAQRRQTVQRLQPLIAPKSCKSVAGDIAPTGWCSIWVKKAG